MTTARDVIAKAIDKAFTDYGLRIDWRLRDATVGAILAELPSAPEPVRLELAALLNPWRPIEEAPKDGTEILVYTTDQSAWYVVFWDDEPGCPSHPWQTPDGISYHRDVPTHWLPLPAPPSKDKA